jgi:hypothetical protein
MKKERFVTPGEERGIGRECVDPKEFVEPQVLS